MIDRQRHARCACGNVDLEVVGAPIMSVACYCDSCQRAGHQLATPPDAPVVLKADGGTPFVLYRKDRVACREGATLLLERRLTPESSTRRVVAACCHSAMFLEFDGGHWLSLYRDRFAAEDRPAIEMRTMTIDRKPGVEFSDAVPSPRKHSVRFMWKLLAAWVAMGFRTPAIDYVRGSPR